MILKFDIMCVKKRSNLKNANEIAFVFRFNEEDYNYDCILPFSDTTERLN